MNKSDGIMEFMKYSNKAYTWLNASSQSTNVLFRAAICQSVLPPNHCPIWYCSTRKFGSNPILYKFNSDQILWLQAAHHLMMAG